MYDLTLAQNTASGGDKPSIGPVKPLRRGEKSLYYYVNGVRTNGAPPDLRGDVSGLRGRVSPDLYGDVSGLWGEVTALRGDVSGLRGDVSGLRGDVSPELRGDVSPELRGEVTRPPIGDYVRNKRKEGCAHE